jgi:acyl-CoA synthetase (AMP-forming)/AMP-acid ligase II
MKMQPAPDITLGALLRHNDRSGRARLEADNGSVPYAALRTATSFIGDQMDLTGRSALLAVPDQLSAALALIQLDGVARRIVLCPPDVEPRHFAAVVADAAVDVVVCRDSTAEIAALGLPVVIAGPTVNGTARPTPCTRRTEWVLLTSGTSGSPKLVLHDLASLVGAIRPSDGAQESIVWATFYDIRRYGGLQIFLRAILGGHSMILSQAGEPVAAHLARLQRGGVTHISGTPSHWRRALMSGAAHLMSPRYVRLSGEIADQAILDALQAAWPQAGVSHAYASTEAGVGFNVIDGRAGFPAAIVDAPAAGAEVAIRIVEGALQLRSGRAAVRYLGETHSAIVAADGFVDTSDLVERRGDRYHFIGRRGGMINVGGAKVFPEEIEAVLNGHPAVRVSLVQGRRNPIIGALVVADVVLVGPAANTPPGADQAIIAELLDHCRAMLPAHKVPARLRIVAHLDIAASGKLARPHA